MTTMTPEFASRWSYPESSARTTPPIVFVVADDECVRRSLKDLIRTTGFEVEACGSVEDFLSVPRSAVPCCLLLDAGTKTLDLQRQVGAQIDVPVVFITDRPDVRMIVAAMKGGAFDVLTEPVSPEQLRSAVDAAIEVSRAALLRDVALRSLQDCYASLSRREVEVMGLVVSGLLNKQVGFELGISEITVKAHRGQVMRKMNADSLPHLVRMAASLNAARPDSTKNLGWPSGPTARRQRVWAGIRAGADIPTRQPFGPAMCTA